MNDVALHPGRTGTDELVPSRYALRAGEIEVLVISDGVLPLPAATLATNAKPAELAAWLDDMRQPPDVFKWPLNVVVVRSGGRTVLIDSGVGAEVGFSQIKGQNPKQDSQAEYYAHARIRIAANALIRSLGSCRGFFL